MDAKKILAVTILVLLAFSLGCTGTIPDDTDSLDGGVDVNGDSETAEVDATMEELDSDLEELDSLIEDSNINIDDVVVDEETI